jgi:Fic family protein
MMENLSMFWEVEHDFRLLRADSPLDAIKIFKKNFVEITWNCLSTFENNPASLPQTETILKGQSVSGISISDLMQVKNFGDGAKKLLEFLSSDTFGLDEKTASALHNFTGKEEALKWGKFRDRPVHIRGVGYNPPDAEDLPGIAQRGFSFLNHHISSPIERALGVFLFMARTQFFFDANKRTALLMMNGVLLQNGFYPVTFMQRDSEEFTKILNDFYNSANASGMMNFFAEATLKLYTDVKGTAQEVTKDGHAKRFKS